MKILKNGTDAILHRQIRFRCKACGCLFEADNTEYTIKNTVGSGYTQNYAEATCPYCSGTVYCDIDDDGFEIPPVHDARMEDLV